MELPTTKESFAVQAQIRENANVMRDSLLDLQNWEQEIKKKEKNVKADYNIIEVSILYFILGYSRVFDF